MCSLVRKTYWQNWFRIVQKVGNVCFPSQHWGHVSVHNTFEVCSADPTCENELGWAPMSQLMSYALSILVLNFICVFKSAKHFHV